VQLKLDQYLYGGHKILNSFVEQYDERVAQEKEMPSSVMREYRGRLTDAIDGLQQTEIRTHNGPCLSDLRKSHEKERDHMLANLEKFQQQLRSRV
jgi:hypothetical protein